MITAVSAYTQIFDAIYTFTTLGTKVTASTVKTALALAAQLIVRTVLAFFAASHTDHRAFRASVAAVADLLHAVFAQPAVRAIVALSTDAVKADAALGAKLSLRAVGAFFTALRTDVGTVGASVAVVADLLHAHFTHAAFLAVIALTAAAFETDLAVAAKLIIRAAFTLLAAFRTDYGTFRAALTASDADIINAKFAKITVNAVVAVSAHTVVADPAVLANTAISAVFAFFAAGFTNKDAFGASPAAFTDIFRTVLAKQTVGTVISLSTNTGEAGSAVGAKLVFCTDYTLLITFAAAAGTI